MNGEGDSGRTASATVRPGLLQYWPEVDGLRAVAMMAILVFHFDRTLLPGAFASVDVFYMISGFLITAILLQSHQDGKFSFASFYQRRIARIAPAFFLVLWATLIAAWLIYPRLEFAQTGSAAAFAAISAANIKAVIAAGDYFQASPDTQPLLHYWSLSVEEQYYLLFPCYIYAVVRWTRRAVAITAVVTLLSFAICVAATSWNHIWAFYMLPARAWELFAGVLITLLRWRGMDIPIRWAPALGWIGLLTILASWVVLREARFPGWIALMPVLGSVALLATAGHDTRINRWLGSWLPVEIGKRSYGLYLWHWPIFSFVDFQCFAAGFWVRTLLKFGLLTIAVWATYRFVERPARKSLSRSQFRRIAFAGFALAVVGSFAAGAAIRQINWFDVQSNGFTGGGKLVGHGKAKVMLVGDSQVVKYAPGFARLAEERGFTLRILAQPGAETLAGRPGTHWPEVRQWIARDRPDVVIFASLWPRQVMADRQPLSDTLDQLKALGVGHVFLAFQPPVPDADRAAIRSGALPPWRERPSEPPRRLRVHARMAEIAAGRAELIDPVPLFLKPDGSIDLIAANGRMNWSDELHLSDDGAARVMPLFDRAIAKALAERR